MKFLSLISLVPLALAHGPYGKDLGDDFSLQAYGWKSGVRLEATMPKNTYVGLSLGKYSMWNTDMIVFQEAGKNSKGADYYGKGYRPPVRDEF
jgi:hypothetical protein